MASFQRLVITSAGTLADFKSLCDLTPGNLPAMNNFVDYLTGVIGGGIQGASFAFKVGATKATGTITFSSLANNDTITVAGVVLTAKTSGATGAQFNLGADDTAAAANAVTLINSIASLSGIVTATSNLAVITVTAAVPGTVGNGLGLAISAHGSVSGALLTTGSDGTAYSVTSLA
jgi:hypothetical protein